MAPGSLFRYRSEVLSELLRLGIRPRPATDPHLVYDHLKALYSFEIRGLKARLRPAPGERPPVEPLRAGLAALRTRYPLLEIHPRIWVEGDGGYNSRP